MTNIIPSNIFPVCMKLATEHSEQPKFHESKTVSETFVKLL